MKKIHYMKKFTLLLSLLLTIVSLHAQDYQISFAGTGASTNVGKVTIVNQTQGKSISLLGSETLHLMAIITGYASRLDNVNSLLHIYPNPSSDYFNIEFGAIKSGPANIKLFDLTGREIGNLKQTLPSGIHSFRVSRLNYGIYTIKVDLENQSYSGKLISQGSSNSQVTITYFGNKGVVQETIKIKNATTERFWQYTTGDILSFTGTSGNLSTIIVDVPTKSKILTFNFTASLPTVTTTAATNIISTGAMLGGNVTGDDNATFTERGVVFSTNANPTILDTKVINGTGIGIGTFSSTISGLTPNTTYYVRTYATNSTGTVYGDQISFTTLVTNPPYSASVYVASTTYDFSSEANIPYSENNEITVQSPTKDGFNSLFISIPEDKELSVRNALHIDITDHFKVVGIDNREGYMNNLIYRMSGGYSTRMSVQFAITITNAEKHNPPLAFTGFSMGGTTETAWNVTATYALLDETLLSNGNDTTTEHGVMYSTELNFTPSFTKIVNSSGENAASSLVYDLTPNTLYYCRAYATNSQGTSYGSVVSFKTKESDRTLPYKATMCVNNEGFGWGQEVAIPYVENKEISVSTPTKAGDNYLYFSIPADKSLIVKDIGGVDITNQFLIVGSDDSPDYQNNYIYRRNQIFSSATSMNLNVTISSIKLPSQTIVTTEEVSSISANTVILGGSVINDDNIPIIEKGIVISTSENPKITDTKVVNGAGNGSFSSTIPGLTGNTSYYARAYAINNKSTYYGPQVRFKTLAQYRMAMCETQTSYDIFSEIEIPYAENKEIVLNGTITGGYNFFFISVPANKTFIVRDQMGLDITSEFLIVGEDNRECYWNNNIYKYRWSQYIKFYITITGSETGSIIYIDGDVYHTNTIDSQVWMVENLKTTKYNGGSSIPNVTNNVAWNGLTTGAYCWYNNDISYKDPYGALYNWYALNTGKLAPIGWHVPTDAEWESLINHLGGESVAGGKLKESGTIHWQTPNTGATNESGFTAVPGGFRSQDGIISNKGGSGYWWSSTEDNTSNAKKLFINNNSSTANRGSGVKEMGYSVRCIKDDKVLPSISTMAGSDITTTSAIGGGMVTSEGSGPVTEYGMCWNITGNPTTGDNKTVDGNGKGGFTSKLTGLTANTTYYMRSYATNIIGTTYGNQVNFTTLLDLPSGTVTDIEGNVYHTLTIGTQVWMLENLKTTKLNDGTSIPNISNDSIWTSLITPGYCWYDNTISYKNPYGALYNWYTVNSGKLAPVGWHIPTDAEWTILINYLGGEKIAGNKLKEKGSAHWESSNTGATNETGFTALPGGYRSNKFTYIGSFSIWWSSTEYYTTGAMYRNIISSGGVVYGDRYSKYYGLNVRCVKD